MNLEGRKTGKEEDMSKTKIEGAKARRGTNAWYVQQVAEQRSDDRYSQNLGAWLRREIRNGFQPDSLEVREGNDGRRYIGRVEPGALFFSGSNLANVLTRGGRAGRFAYMGGNEWRPVRGFWKRYLRLGKCALDASHLWYPERWCIREDNTRQCRFCGRQEIYREREVVQKVGEWILIEG
jgi:hypothetical protein